MERVVEEDAAQLAPAGTGESSSLPPSAAQDRPAAGLCLGSTPNTSRALLTPALSEPQRPGPPARVASVGLPSGHTLMHLNSMRGHDGGPNSSGLGSGNSPLPNSAELSRRLRGLLATTVNFRDVSLELMPSSDQGVLEAAEDADADAATGSAAPLGPLSTSTSGAFAGLGGGGEGGEASGTGRDAGPGSGLAPGGAVVPLGGSMRVRSGAVVRKNKLVIILVGLPGRGKTFLCNKLCCYLNWLGHATRHFNVGQYRRHQKCADEVQDAAFFDHANESGVEARNRALHAALDDLTAYLRSDSGQVAIFDATNTTVARRNLLRAKFHGVLQYMFIETICSDPAVLELNYRNKMRYSPDYKGVDTDKAVADFLARIKKYEEVYEPIDDRNLHYIKLIDMVTGRGHMDINRISGYLPGKIVFFLMQVCKAGLTSPRKIILSRHGESQYNEKALIGGNSSLSVRGERYSRALPEAVIARLPQDEAVSVAVWTSTLKRTIETARFLPFPKLRWKALDEINAGICDGMTYEDIAERYPAEYEARKKDKLRYRYPSGESYMDVIQRVEPVIIEMERERECLVIVAHQAILRCLYAYFMNVPSEDIPRVAIPLHTIIELTPLPDGTMSEVRIAVDIDRPELFLGAPACAATASTGSDAGSPQPSRSCTPEGEAAALVPAPPAAADLAGAQADEVKVAELVAAS